MDIELLAPTTSHQLSIFSCQDEVCISEDQNYIAMT